MSKKNPNPWMEVKVPNLTKAEAKEEGAYWAKQGYGVRKTRGLFLQRPIQKWQK